MASKTKQAQIAYPTPSVSDITSQTTATPVVVTSAPVSSTPSSTDSDSLNSKCSSHYTSLLLGLKMRGFGVGKWNGFGGKVERGESIRQAAVRECKEEAGVESEQIDQTIEICQSN